VQRQNIDDLTHVSISGPRNLVVAALGAGAGWKCGLGIRVEAWYWGRRMLPDPRAQILVVDDEANLRRVLSAQLQREGYDVHSAADGYEALQILSNHHVDVVVTDLRMPGIDGMALLRE